jgi:CHASE3 domain sensor protein
MSMQFGPVNLFRRWEWLAVVLAGTLFAITVAAVQINLVLVGRVQAEMVQARETALAIQELLQLTTDAETGQRGYLLTGRRVYLEPYETALRRLPASRDRLGVLLDRVPDKAAATQKVRASIDAKLAELGKTIELIRSGNRKDALELVNSDAGNRRMLEIRTILSEIEETVRSSLDKRVTLLNNTVARTALLAVIFGLCACTILAFGAWRLRASMNRSTALVEQLAFEEQQYRKLALSLEQRGEAERA